MAHVLFIEPDALLARTYKQALEAAGYGVEACALAQTAIAAADAARPDIVIMELQLVGHSGIEFLYEFRSYADWQGIPLLVHTHVPPGEFIDSRQHLFGNLGVAEYLYKPQTSLRQLLASVRTHAPLTVPE